MTTPPDPITRPNINQVQPPAISLLRENPDDQFTHLAYTRALDRVAPFLQPEVHVVMEGEPGAGKRFHAEVLHERTRAEADGEFIEVTSETPEDVLRTILFDEERKLLEGKMGRRLPSLHGQSTLYLRNIGEFSVLHQTMLSRFLIQQDALHSPNRQIQLVASTVLPWHDLLQGKVLTNSLTKSMQEFAVCRIAPLRERLDEIPSLVHMFLLEVSRQKNNDAWRVQEETLDQLKTRQWRDNVRELRHVIEDAAANCPDGTLKLPDPFLDEFELLWEMFRTIQSGKRLHIEPLLASLEKAIVERALIKYDFDQRKTARMLSMTEPNLTYRIRKFNIYIPAPGQSQ